MADAAPSDMRLILTLLLLTLSAPAWAEWVKYSESGDGTSYYYDPATIKKSAWWSSLWKGKFGRVWVLIDPKKQDAEGVLSSEVMWEFDCKEERSRTLASTDYSERMAGGKILTRDDEPAKWSYIRPNTVAADILKLVCR